MAFIQFELWKDCSNGCQYCFNQYVQRKRNKEAALDYAIKNLSGRTVEAGSSIGLMGGEFFGGQLNSPVVKKKFYQLCGLIMDKLSAGPVGRFLITTALMADDLSDWLEFCEFVHDRGFDKHLLVCTSWDKLYRFTDRTRENWERAMQETHARYPDMPVHVEMILTEYLIQDVLADPEYLHKFSDKWNCRVDFNIPYLPQYNELFGTTKATFEEKMPGFLPKRKSFLKMLQTRNDYFDLAGIADHRFHSSELHYTLNDKDWIVLPERDKMETTCTNLKACANCCGYLDSEIKMQDDIRVFLKSSLG